MTKEEERVAVKLFETDLKIQLDIDDSVEAAVRTLISQYRDALRRGNRYYPWEALIQVAQRRLNREPA